VGAPKREKKSKAGRPSNGLTEVALVIRGPAALFGAASRRAKAEGISASEWWRRAAQIRIGWKEGD
jgi:hypothetical protein